MHNSVREIAESSGRRGRHSVRRISAAIVSAALLSAGALAVSVAPAGAATTVVTAGSLAPHGAWSLEPTSNTGSFSFVTGPAATPGGAGSLALAIASGQHEWLNNYAYGACQNGPACNAPASSWTPLASVTALSFSTYRASGTTIPTINVEVDPSGSGSGYSTFVFVPNGGTIVNSTWQAWNALSPVDGTWFSSQNVGSGPFNCAPQSCNASFAQIVAGYPNAKIKYGLGINVGTGGTFAGNVDNFNVGVLGNTTTYDFENSPSAPRPVAPVPGNKKAVVSWKPPLSNGGATITGYEVQPYIGSTAQPVHIYNSTATTQSVGGLQNGKMYKFTIAARTASGTGAWSALSGGTIVGAPGRPGNAKITVAGGGVLKVSFKPPADNGAKITRFTATCTSANGGTTRTRSGVKTPVGVTGATAGKTYRCTVTATNSRGTGPKSVASPPATAA
jgi:hypothetical protein